MSILYGVTFPYLAYRYRDGFDQRRGKYSRDFRNSFRNERPLWIHAVSVGEVQSSLPFISEIRKDRPYHPLILSTITSTGKEMSSRLLTGKVDAHFYYPWDVPRIVGRALDVIDPVAYVTLETEIWPNLLTELSRRGIPAFMVNGRFSDKSFSSMMKRASFWKEVLSLYTFILVRERADEIKLSRLGVPGKKIIFTSDCKVDALIERKKKADLEEVRNLVGAGKPVFVGGSTHPGEDEIVLEAFRIVREKIPEARLVLVPRHPERAANVMDLASPYGKPCLMSDLMKGWNILVVDRIGVLFDIYGVVDAAFIGGSLVPRGGQNLMEPSAFGIPVSHGPHMEDFSEASGRLGKLGVAVEIMDATSLAEEWIRSLDMDFREYVAKGCREFFRDTAGAASSSWQLIKPYLE